MVTSSSTRRRCPITRRRSTGTASGTSRPTRTARSGSSTTASACPANGMSAGGCRRRERRGPGPGLPGRDALHGDPPGGVERQGPAAGHGPGPHRPGRAVPDDVARPAERADVDFAEAQARAYNDWCSDHVQEGEGRLFGAGAVPPMHDPDDVARVAAEIRRVATLPGMVSVFMRPNPAVDWRPFNDPVYDPIWQAASETGLPIALHPFLAADLPGRARGCAWPGPAGPMAATWTTSTRSGRHDRTSSWSIPSFGRARLHPGDRQPGRRDELHRLSCWPAASASGSRRRSSSSWRPTVAGSCRGWSGWTTTAASSSGRSPTSRCCRRTTCGGSAGSASIRTRRCCA